MISGAAIPRAKPMTLTDQINEIVPKLDGWCSVPKALMLAELILHNRMQNVVEIGVFGGRSLIPMALAMQHNGSGIVTGIDPWEASASVVGMHGADLTWWSKLNHQEIYDRFRRHVSNLGIENFCSIIRERSDDVKPVGPIDLLHIDGNHSIQALTDARRYACLVRVGGFCFGDDIGWEGGGVTAAVTELYRLGFTKLYDLDAGAMFRRISEKSLLV